MSCLEVFGPSARVHGGQVRKQTGATCIQRRKDGHDRPFRLRPEYRMSIVLLCSRPNCYGLIVPIGFKLYVFRTFGCGPDSRTSVICRFPLTTMLYRLCTDEYPTHTCGPGPCICHYRGSLLLLKTCLHKDCSTHIVAEVKPNSLYSSIHPPCVEPCNPPHGTIQHRLCVCCLQ